MSSNFLNFSSTFAAFSEMAIHYNGSSNGNTFDITSDYHVVKTTSAAFKVNITLTSGGTQLHYIDYVLKNGTAVAVYYNGANYTGFQAFSFYLASMSVYFIANVFGTQGVLGQLTSTGFVQVTGTGTVMIGPTKLNVTNYAATHLPIVQNSCGSSIDFSKFSLQTGTVAGVSQTLLTSMQIAGSITTSSSSMALDFTYHITSITKT